VLLIVAALGAGAAMAIMLPGPVQSAADLPSGAVARVGDATISRAKLDHWFDINGSRSAPPRRRARDYRAPRFAGCVARERRAQRSSRSTSSSSDDPDPPPAPAAWRALAPRAVSPAGCRRCGGDDIVWSLAERVWLCVPCDEVVLGLAA